MSPIQDIQEIENFLAGGFTTSTEEENYAFAASLALDRLRYFVGQVARGPSIEAELDEVDRG